MSTTNFQDFEIEIVEDSSIVNEDQIYEESFEKQANQQIVIEDNSSDLVVEELDDRQAVEISDWNSSEDFTNYIVASARNLPPTYSDSKSSYKRAFAYLEKLSNDLIQGIEQDAEYSNLSQKQLSTLDAVEEGIENALKEQQARERNTRPYLALGRKIQGARKELKSLLGPLPVRTAAIRSSPLGG